MVEPWYNLDNWTNQSGFFEIIKVANQYTANLFGTLFLLGFFIMLMIITGRYQVKQRLAVSAWTTAIIGIIYIPLGIINLWVIYLLIILFVGGLIGLFID